MEFSWIRVEQNEKKFKYTVKSHFYSLTNNELKQHP